MANQRERLAEQNRKLAAETRRIIKESSDLLKEPAPDSFLGRPRQKPVEKEEE